MAILDAASPKDLQHLLELLPASKLKERWSEVGRRKGELSLTVAETRPRDELVRFAHEKLGCCKQHVYVLRSEEPLVELHEVEIGSGQQVLEVDRTKAFYLVRMKYDVILNDPLQRSSLEFLWPFRLEITRGHLVVRFVILEKNISSYFGGRKTHVDGKNVDEKSILQQIVGSFQEELKPADLHRGLKDLWDSGFMDATRVQYKKPISTASEVMDEAKGIKEVNPSLYRVIQESTLLKTLFRINTNNGSIAPVFWTEPSQGSIDFPRYSDEAGDTDNVIDEILRRN